MKVKKTLADFADFIKQIEVDDNGSMTNIEFYYNGRWEKVFSMHKIDYMNFINYRLRITPKPKMRAMTLEEINMDRNDEIYYIHKDTYPSCRAPYFKKGISLRDNTVIYINKGGIADGIPHGKFVESFTRPDGSRFEVEDN